MTTRLALVSALLVTLAIPTAATEAPASVLALDPGARRAGAEVRLVERGPDRMVLQLDVAGLEREAVAVEGRAFTVLTLPGGGVRGAAGEAALPTVTRLVAVPEGAGVTARVADHAVRALGRLDLAPVQPIRDAADAVPRFDAAAYARSARREPTVVVGQAARLHGLRVVPVTFAPVGRDPQTGEVTAAPRLEVELAFTAGAAPGPARPARTLVPESFATIHEQLVLGWERDASAPVGPGSVIYVCPDAPSVVAEVDRLAGWRRQQGHHVEVVTTATTGPTASSIRNWLENRYQTIEPPLEFVTLVGDANGAIAVPTSYETQSGYYGEGDHDFARLDGDDVLPDVHVGRISVQTPTQLSTAIDKILGYETAPDLSDTDWFTTAGLTGDPYTSGYSCIFTNQFVKQELLRLGYTRVDTIWSGNFLSQMMNTINQGETVFTYRGLAGMSGMSASHIGYLTNGGQLPFACILTCDTGSFADDLTARSEAWLRAANGGGIAAIGTATLGTHTRYNNCMFLGIMDHLLGSGDFRFGPALTRGKLNFWVNYWTTEPGKVWTWMTWNNLMGDPATELWTGVPRALAVDHPAALATTADALPVTVTAEGAPLAGARVAAYQDGTVRSWALTDDAGHAVLDVAGATAGDVHVTVTGHDLHPYRGVATVGPVPRSLDLTDVSVDDRQGNGDGDANPGEPLRVNVALTNGGTSDAPDATAVLVDGPPWASFTPAELAFGTVVAGATVWGAGFLDVTLAADAPGGAQAEFELVAASGAESWTSRLVVPVVGPHGAVEYPVWGTPGGDPDPGEAGSLQLVLRNVGNLDATGVTGTLRTDSRWLEITDAAGSWGAMPVGAFAQQQDAFAVSVDPECLPGQPVDFEVDLAFTGGGVQTIAFTAPMGQPAAGDPTGPDAYGYYAFSNDDDHPHAPDYDWVELAGVGQNTGINDAYRWDDETVVMDLPFPFVYYGREYHQVSICSNGWLAFGATGLCLYRNWRLPADGSPDAMVCAFWDDLAQGAVYTWYDEANHRFIVQWDDFETWYYYYPPDGYYSGSCTFQIILTDPAHSGTETGDGLITMQYQGVTVANDETNRFTTGLQDQTRTMGLTYVYGNDYADGAAGVYGGRAITFRPIPSEVQDVTDAPRPPAVLALAPNHPNPFNPRTVISFSLPRAQAAELQVYDLRGRRVRTLARGELAAGRHQVAWDGRDDAGQAVPSGTYVYRLITEDGVLGRKMVLLK